MILGPDGKVLVDPVDAWFNEMSLRALEGAIAKQSAFASRIPPLLLDEFGKPIARAVFGVGDTITVRLPQRFGPPVGADTSQASRNRSDRPEQTAKGASQGRICPYCGLTCDLPAGVDMKGRCGCCCQWKDAR